MKDKTEAPTASSESSKPQEKSNQGFYKRRRGVFVHIMDGTIDLLEDGIHDYLCLKANLVIGGDSKPAGICFTSAPDIYAHCRRVSERTVQRCLEHLEDINWIKTFREPNQRGNYPVLICRATVHDLSGNEYRVNADATEVWQHPVYERVAQLSPETSNSGAYKIGERREKRERVSRDQQQLSLSGGVWEELKIKTLPCRYKGFVELVAETTRAEGENLVAYCRRIMDLCGEQGIRYAELFYKRFKQAEEVEKQNAGSATASKGEGYSVPDGVYVQA